MIIVTDSSSDITTDEAKKLGIIVVPIEVIMNGKKYSQDTRDQIADFYEDLENTTEIPRTSRTSLDVYLKIYNEAQETNQDVIVLPLSSELSGAYESAVLTANQSVWKDRIFVIDTKLAILSLRIVVEQAVKLRDSGKKAIEIVEEINELCPRVTVFGVIGTLKYLKMGGRIPKSLAYIGEKLRIKPIIELKNGKVIEMAKKRGFEAATKELSRRLFYEGYDPNYPVYFGYTQHKEIAQIFMDEVLEQTQLSDTDIYPIGPSIGAHLGGDGIGIAYVRKK